ncbi:hypothetical protein FACS1894105_14540 [Clostridia bacterium]|nr:hypothetical protein FACS1894105_14540 [Clostridia bacterium]
MSNKPPRYHSRIIMRNYTALPDGELLSLIGELPGENTSTILLCDPDTAKEYAIVGKYGSYSAYARVADNKFDREEIW